MRRRPERQVPAGPKEIERLAIADVGIDPVPGRRRDSQVERLRVRRVPRLERRVHDLDVRILGECGPRTGREFGPSSTQVTRSPRSASRRVAFPEPHPISSTRSPVATPALTDKVVEQRRRVLRPRPVVALRSSVERRAPACGLPHLAGYDTAAMFQKTTLENGLRVVTAPMPAAKSVAVMVMVAAGSRYETKPTNGIAHFAEHMFFKGTERRPTAKDISAEVDGIGGEFNAFTSKEYTGYYIKCAAEHRSLALDVLADQLLHSQVRRRRARAREGRDHRGAEHVRGHAA